MSNLKPCPGCGNQKDLVCDQSTETAEFVVWCQCGWQGPSFSGFREFPEWDEALAKKQAVEAWNTRAQRGEGLGLNMSANKHIGYCSSLHESYALHDGKCPVCENVTLQLEYAKIQAEKELLEIQIKSVVAFCLCLIATEEGSKEKDENSN